MKDSLPPRGQFLTKKPKEDFPTDPLEELDEALVSPIEEQPNAFVEPENEYEDTGDEI
jgi:hypothetical protein